LTLASHSFAFAEPVHVSPLVVRKGGRVGPHPYGNSQLAGGDDTELIAVRRLDVAVQSVECEVGIARPRTPRTA
jgi:hypothetical protein